MQNAIVNVNGEILSPSEAVVSVFDRGYLYGDSLYEVMRSYGKSIFGLEEHLIRLERSAELCGMKLNQSREALRSEIQRTLMAFHEVPGQETTDAYCRLILSRGVGKIGFGLPCVLTPSQYVILVQPLELPTEHQLARGLKLKISSRLRNDRRALDPAMKSGNYLNNLLAYLEVAAENYDDALLCNTDGHVTEGTTFNIFYYRRGILATPPLDIGILEGITRRLVLKMARDMEIPVREVRFPPERLHEADEVFITSTIKDVFPVTQVDQHLIGSRTRSTGKVTPGKPGPMTLRLRESFQQLVLRELNS